MLIFLHLLSETGDELTIFVPKVEEPKTEAARMMQAMGITNVDKNSQNLGIGIVGVVLMFVPIVILVAFDLGILKQHLKMMARNLKEGYQRFRHRNRQVAPVSEQTGGPGPGKIGCTEP